MRRHLLRRALLCGAVQKRRRQRYFFAACAGRFEFRLADGAANPYLLQAAILAAGLDGLRHRRDPGPRLDINMYTDGHRVEGVKRLPLNMLDAMRALKASPVLNEALGAFVPSYLTLKHEEWNAYCRHLTQWERDTTLDC